MGGGGSILVLLILSSIATAVVECSVSYDQKALVINGQRRILMGGDIHYPRSAPEMWSDIIKKAKLGGLDMIQTYVFWNGHEPSPGQYNFEGRYDLVKFVKLCQQQGLYVSLRIGPYVCAEWNFGGFPVWLKFVPGISFRTDNEPFKKAMYTFTKKIVDMMKSEGLFEPQGGPIIMAQIENEYRTNELIFGSPGVAYVNWAADMAVGLDTGVPWIMSKQEDAPDPVINTCNGLYCDNFKPNKAHKPSMWTEAWTGWYTTYGNATSQRPVEDLAFAVTSFIQKGGSLVSYYMYHGGTNFGHTSGGPFITTSYDYNAPIDEYGLARQPKWGHLRQLHKALKLCEPALISGDPVVTSLGLSQQAYVYSAGPGKCAAFLSNLDAESTARVRFDNGYYNLPAWSISILPDCKNVVFNTAQVSVQRARMKMTPTLTGFVWKSFEDNVIASQQDVLSPRDSFITTVGLLDHMNTTRDTSDYLWYVTSVDVAEDDPLVSKGGQSVLSIKVARDAFHIFINGEFQGSRFGSRHTRRIRYSSPVTLKVGRNTIAILTMTVGLQNIGHRFESWFTGLLGPVTLDGFKEGERDLSQNKWWYKIGMKGESMNLYAASGESSIQWNGGQKGARLRQQLVWYKTLFDSPPGRKPVGLDLSSMGKGEAWVNGQSIGRYWPSYIVRGNCSEICDYRGVYSPSKCATNCGRYSQSWYHIPRSWLQPKGNTLVLFEEIGGDTSLVSVGTRSVGRVCSHMSSSLSVTNLRESDGNGQNTYVPKVNLLCGKGQNISSIRFASYGTPQGECGRFRKGACHYPQSYGIVTKKCVGKRQCFLSADPQFFGGDPCPGVSKYLGVEATCR